MLEYWKVIKNSTLFKLGFVFGISFVLYLLAPFFLPILLAIALSFALYPLVNFIQSIKLKNEKLANSAYDFSPSYVAAIIISLLGFMMFITAILFYLILPLFGQMNDVVSKLAVLANRSTAYAGQLGQGSMFLPVLPSNIDMLMDDAIHWAMGFVGTAINNLLESSLGIISNLVGLIIVPFLAFYLLRDWRQLRDMFVNVFQDQDRPLVHHVLDEIGETLMAYVGAMGKLSLLAGVSISCGTMIIGVDYPLVLGFWAMLAETVPVVGPMMGAVPAIFLAYSKSQTAACMVAAFYFIYYQMDANVIMPRLMGKHINLHPVFLIVSLLIGAKLFGIIGMVFAVPVAAVYRVLYRELWHAGEIHTDSAHCPKHMKQK